MVGTDEDGIEHGIETLRGAVIRMGPPANIRDKACRLSQARFLRGLIDTVLAEKGIGPRF